jgi:hypothetical protein
LLSSDRFGHVQRRTVLILQRFTPYTVTSRTEKEASRCIPFQHSQFKRFTTIPCSKSFTKNCNGLHKTVYFLRHRTVQLSYGSVGFNSWIQPIQTSAVVLAPPKGLVISPDGPDTMKFSVNEHRHTNAAGMSTSPSPQTSLPRNEPYTLLRPKPFTQHEATIRVFLTQPHPATFAL